MFLTRDDIICLTGRKRLKCQLQWLRERGFKFEVNCAGVPVVLRSVVQARLGEKPEPRRVPQPRFERLNNG